jgi:hypothetical protein
VCDESSPLIDLCVHILNKLLVCPCESSASFLESVCTTCIGSAIVSAAEEFDAGFTSPELSSTSAGSSFSFSGAFSPFSA